MKKLLLLIGLAFSLTINAQLATDVEHSFGAFNGAGFNGTVNSITMQIDANDDGIVDLDQKFIVGGSFTSYNMQTVNRLVRFNSDCSFDNTFNIGSGFDNSVTTVAFETNGKILVGGDFTSYNEIPANKIVRLNSDGSIDTSFSIGNGFNNSVKKIIVQPNGKILVGGFFTSYNGTTQNAIVRLNADGSVDGSFVSALPFDFAINDIALQQDDKILVGSNTNVYGGLKRLNSNGSYDNSLNIGTGFNDKVTRIAVQTNGTIWVGGAFCRLNGFSGYYQTGLTSLTSNGAVIPITTNIIGYGGWFGGVGCGSYENRIVSLLSIQPDGKIYVAGWRQAAFPYPNGGGPLIITDRISGRYNSDGSIDSNFVSYQPATISDLFTSVAVQPDGKLLVGGSYSSYDNNSDNANLVRLYGSTALSTTQFSTTTLKLYPNPTNSLLNIKTSDSVVLDKISITDLTGKTVLEQTQNTNQVSVEKLATGVYILNGYSEGNKFQEKFIKE